jgi:hypothetical protein
MTSTLDGGEWSASRPGRFTPRERASVTHRMLDYVTGWWWLVAIIIIIIIIIIIPWIFFL